MPTCIPYNPEVSKNQVEKSEALELAREALVRSEHRAGRNNPVGCTAEEWRVAREMRASGVPAHA